MNDYSDLRSAKKDQSAAVALAGKTRGAICPDSYRDAQRFGYFGAIAKVTNRKNEKERQHTLQEKPVLTLQ